MQMSLSLPINHDENMLLVQERMRGAEVTRPRDLNVRAYHGVMNMCTTTDIDRVVKTGI